MAIVQDIEHAHQIIDDTVGADWNDTIKHSEPQVIVASAMVAKEAREDVAALEAKVEALEKKFEEALNE